jgi:hypothetical protein
VCRRGRQGDADAAGGLIGVAVDLDRTREGGADLPGQRQGGRGRAGAVRAQILEQHDELVAAEARHGIHLAHGVGQPPGHRLEQGIAGGVAAGIVDAFEVVEVDVQYRAITAAGMRLGDQPVQPLHQHAPVRQAGQHVKEGQLADGLGGTALLGDVAPDHDPVRDRSGVAGEGHHIHFYPARVPALGVIHQLGADRFAACHCAVEELDRGRIRVRAKQYAHAATDDLVGAITAAAFEGGVNEDDRLRFAFDDLHDEHHVVQAGQRRRGQPQFAVQCRQCSLSLLERLGKAAHVAQGRRQSFQQLAACERDEHADTGEIERDDAGTRHGILGEVGDAQFAVARQSEHHHGKAAQCQHDECRAHAEQDDCQHGQGHQIAQTKRADGHHRSNGDTEQHRQEIPYPHPIRQLIEVADCEYPAQGQAIHQCDRRDALMNGEQ